MQHSDQPESSGMPHRVNRKKDPKTKADVWPYEIELSLIEGLREFGHRRERIGRCKFLSEYIKKTTGVYRSPQQVSSRLQMIKNGKNTSLTDLIQSTQRKSPTQALHTHVFRLDSTSRSSQRHELFCEDNVQTPSSSLSSNARLSASPFFDWNQGDLRDNWSLNVDQPQPNPVEDRAIEFVYSPDASTVAYNNDTLLREQAHNNGYSQPTLPPNPAQEYIPVENDMLPGMGGEPNFLPDVFLWGWYNNPQYPH